MAIGVQSPSPVTFLHCLMASSSPLSPPSLTSPDKLTFSSQFPKVGAPDSDLPAAHTCGMLPNPWP